MKNRFRVSKNLSEIVKIISTMKDGRGEIMLWQNVDNKRSINRCEIKSVDISTGSFSVIPDDLSAPFNFDKSAFLYFKGEEQSILFKQRLGFASNKLIIIKFPPEVKVVEKRVNPRSNFISWVDPKIQISKFSGEAKRPRKFALRLVDISQNGISFIISAQQVTFFRHRDLLFIDHILGRESSGDLKAQLVYITKANFKKTPSLRGYRVGAKFVNPLPKGYFDSIMKIEEIIG